MESLVSSRLHAERSERIVDGQTLPRGLGLIFGELVDWGRLAEVL